MRFSFIIASTLVVCIATVSAKGKYTHGSPSSISHTQTSHLMARDVPGLSGLSGVTGLVSGLPLVGGQKEATKKTKKVKKVKKAKKVKKGKKGKKSGAVHPASPPPAVGTVSKSTDATKAQVPK